MCIYENKVQMAAKRPLFLELVLKRIFLKKEDREIFTKSKNLIIRFKKDLD